LTIIACTKEEKTVVIEEQKHESLALFNENMTFVFNEDLTLQVKKEIKSWDEYFTMSFFLKKHYVLISPSLCLEMSKELVGLSKTMNDSLRIKELNNKGMFARLSVFYSEALRLQDMSTISSIKAAEVTEQVEKLVSVYNSINMKINSIYLQKSFDNNVNFDESIFDFNENAERPYLTPKKPRKKRSI
jgi:hypothetical protein